MKRTKPSTFLSPKEIYRLGREIKAGSSEAGLELIKCFQPYLSAQAHILARKYHIYHQIDDVKSIVWLSACTEIAKFDCDRSLDVAGFLSYYLNNAVIEYVSAGCYPTHMPPNIVKAAHSLNGINRKAQMNGVNLTVDDLQKEIKITRRMIDRLSKHDFVTSASSLDQPLQSIGYEDLSLSSILPDDKPSAEEALASKQAKNLIVKCVRDAMGVLSERERFVLKARLLGSVGDGEDLATLEQVGNVYGLSKERIRQIQAGAERKLVIALSRRGGEEYIKELLASV